MNETRRLPALTRLGVLADCHLAAPDMAPTRFNSPVLLGHSRQLLGSALTWLLHRRVDALVLLGDLSQSARIEDYKFLAKHVAASKLPCFVVPGNHDLADGESQERWMKWLDEVLPSSMEIPSMAGVSLGGITLSSGELIAAKDGYRLQTGGIDSLTDTRIPVWLSHFPIVSLENAVRRRHLHYAGDLLNRREIETALLSYRHPLIALTGHLHIRGHAIMENVLQLSMGALVEAPHDASVVSIEVAEDHLSVQRTCHQVGVSAGNDAAAFDADHTHFHWNGLSWNASH